MCGMRTAMLMAVLVVTSGVGAPRASATDISVFLNPPEDGRECGISDFDRGQQEADDFQLIGDYLTITAVRWWGAYGSDPDPALLDDFMIRFFPDAGGVPAVNPFAELSVTDMTRTPTEMTASPWGVHDGGTIYEYVADLLTPVDMSAGTTYYLSVTNDTSSVWGWLEDGSHSHWWRQDDDGEWELSTRNTNLSFELFAAPEPATIVLFGLVAALVLLRGRPA